MKGKVMDTLQTLGRTFMLPIALLPAAGIMLGIGASFTGDAFVSLYGLENILGEGTVLNGFLSILSDSGGVIFGNLPLFFAIAVGLGVAKQAKEVAALSAAVGYFMMYASMTSTIDNFRDIDTLNETAGLVGSVVGFDNTLNMGVFGGIIIGLIVAYLHNRFYKIELPDALSFFSGTRFVPIISAFTAVFVGIVMAFLWPFAGAGIAWLGEAVADLGYVGTFLYGFIYRALIPLGLHHVFYLPFWQTALGGVAEVAGQTVEGAQNILFAQLAAGEPIDPEAAKFFSGMFPFMIFGFPAAAFAMYQAAREDRKKDVKGLMVSASLTSIFTGITEPIEFSFLFASPFLYFGVHVVLGAFSFVLMHMLEVGVGLTFSGGLLDFIFYGILPGQSMTNWIPVVIVGIIYGFVYYFVFRFFINKFDLKTPGREEGDTESKLYTKQDYKDKKAGENTGNATDEMSKDIIEGLGGEGNLNDVSNCATRLRVNVKDGEKVDQPLLKSTGAAGVMVKGNNVQVIYGPKVANIKSNIDEYRQAQKKE
ncbi:PTS system, D-glucosamine-specific IIC component/PTS system, maltose and glucose-specific IIC component [Halolactibacillus halophilus]|uniref:PTS glucose transporter subunit IIB n=1 Tax=Halolactibacillus halophilus TaxID=306540 RepID=A0A1I5QT22_9BACI|nr:PTS transporter subunit EIIC [Halolactibacillus halophilus]GEM01908.1 PTS glucose transporter subunit IIB [Halolactibacillus halophilus]SFP49363.1 PTS system, D-glucosamine-specific IIC component/PTS system, maltose and glucose-specific IIC component [Halolactibacillus halophilus]